MAGKLIVDTIDTDNAFITLNVQQSLIATMNVSGIYSNTGIKMIGSDGSVGGVSNTAIIGNIISSQITSVANTQITGNIISSQITSNPTLYGNVSVTGVIAVGNATPSTSGAGITFPATQSASSNANTLDDYEEGTYTPTFASMTVNSGTPVYSGKYTKIGNLCYAVFGTTGTQNITAVAGTTQFSLPFAASAIAFTQGLGSGPGLAQNAATSATSGLQGPGDGYSGGYFIQGIAATSSIVGTITYQTA